MDRPAGKRVAAHFALGLADLEERHNLTYDTYEEGKLSLEEYLGRVLFHERRPFSRAQFRRCMFAQSRPHSEMIELITELKGQLGLKVAVVSNDGREPNAHRIRAFKRSGLVDMFVSSSFVHVRKPDTELFRLALDLVQTPARQVVYIDNTPMFVKIAEGLGTRSILYTDAGATRARLAQFGLERDRARRL